MFLLMLIYHKYKQIVNRKVKEGRGKREEGDRGSGNRDQGARFAIYV
jgi:hypothetical protein